METQKCETEGCIKNSSFGKLCKFCYKTNFLLNSIDSYDKKKAKSMENKILCIAKTKKGIPCTKQQAEGCGDFCKFILNLKRKKLQLNPKNLRSNVKAQQQNKPLACDTKLLIVMGIVFNIIIPKRKKKSLRKN